MHDSGLGLHLTCPLFDLGRGSSNPGKASLTSQETPGEPTPTVFPMILYESHSLHFPFSNNFSSVAEPWTDKTYLLYAYINFIIETRYRFFVVVVCIFFLGGGVLHLKYIEVLRLGLNWSCTCWPMPQPQQCRIQAMSATYSTAHSKAGSSTQ